MDSAGDEDAIGSRGTCPARAGDATPVELVLEVPRTRRWCETIVARGTRALSWSMAVVPQVNSDARRRAAHPIHSTLADSAMDWDRARRPPNHFDRSARC